MVVVVVILVEVLVVDVVVVVVVPGAVVNVVAVHMISPDTAPNIALILAYSVLQKHCLEWEMNVK